MVRSHFGGFSKAWGGVLTDLQRAAWIALASTNPIPDQFGNPQVVTGINFYQRVNRNLSTIATARLDNAPSDQHVEGLTSVSLAAQVSGDLLELTFTPQTLDPDMHLVVTMSPPVSPGKSFFTPLLKLVFADPNDQTGSPLNLFTPYHDLYGNLQEGQKIGVSAYVINGSNGAASVSAGASAIIAL